MKTRQRKTANNLDRLLDQMMPAGKRAGHEMATTLGPDLMEELSFALALRDTLCPLSPGETLTARVEARILMQLQAGTVTGGVSVEYPAGNRSQSKRHTGIPSINRKPMAMLLIAVMLSLAGLWSAHAFLFQSLPGEAGFEIKERIENFSLILSLSPLDEAELLSDYAARRSNELNHLAGEDKNIQPGLAAYARTLEKWITVLSIVAPLKAASQPDSVVILPPADLLRLQEQVSLLEARLFEFNEHLENPPFTMDYVRILDTGLFFLQQYGDFAAVAMLYQSSSTLVNTTFFPALTTTPAIETGIWKTQTRKAIDPGLFSIGTTRPGETVKITPVVTEATITQTASKTITAAPTVATMQPSATDTLRPSSTLTSTLTLTTQVPVFAYGDINLDHAVTTQDALILSAYLKGTITFTQQQLILADCVQDFVIDRFDLQAVQLRAIGAIGSLPLQPEELPSGDVNGDGQVTPGDALLVEQHLTGVLTLSPGQQYRADACWNGQLQTADRDAIMDYFLQIVPSLPVLPEIAFAK